MDKEDIANLILDMQAPTYNCPIENCGTKLVDPTDFLEHLNLDHSFEELLGIFDWNIVDGKIVIKNKQPNSEKKIEEKSLDEIMRLDDSNIGRRELASHLTKYFLDCKMIPNIEETRYYNVMSYSIHIATVDCWDLERDELLWGFIVLHDTNRSSTIERHVDWMIDNKTENGRENRLEIAKEIAENKYFAC